MPNFTITNLIRLVIAAILLSGVAFAMSAPTMAFVFGVVAALTLAIIVAKDLENM